MDATEVIHPSCWMEIFLMWILGNTENAQSNFHYMYIMYKCHYRIFKIIM